MAKVFKSTRAILDLDEIWLYVAPDNIKAADGLIDAIGQTAKLLAQRPLMGRPHPELAAGLRSFSIGRYVAFYLPHPEGVELVRVLHGAREISDDEFV